MKEDYTKSHVRLHYASENNGGVRKTVSNMINMIKAKVLATNDETTNPITHLEILPGLPPGPYRLILKYPSSSILLHYGLPLPAPSPINNKNNNNLKNNTSNLINNSNNSNNNLIDDNNSNLINTNNNDAESEEVEMLLSATSLLHHHKHSAVIISEVNQRNNKLVPCLAKPTELATSRTGKEGRNEGEWKRRGI